MIAVDFFSRAGDISLGFERAGFDVRVAFEVNRKHIETMLGIFYIRGLGRKIFVLAVTEMARAEIQSLTLLRLASLTLALD